MNGQKIRKADPNNPLHIAATMPGKVLKMFIKKGDVVKKGSPVMLIESMKMECMITAKAQGTVESILKDLDSMVESQDLLLVLV